MRHVREFVAGLVIMLTLNVPGLKAEIVNAEQSGDWLLFENTAVGQLPAHCGMATGGDGPGIVIRYGIGFDFVNFQVGNPDWDFSTVAVGVPVVLAFDGIDSLHVKATGRKYAGDAGNSNGEAKAVSVLEFGIAREEFDSMIRRFSDAGEMQVKIPGGKAWRARMKGSRKAMDLFEACVLRLFANNSKPGND